VEDYGCFSPAVASVIASMNIKTVCRKELLEDRKQRKDLINRTCLGEGAHDCADGNQNVILYRFRWRFEFLSLFTWRFLCV